MPRRLLSLTVVLLAVAGAAPPIAAAAFPGTNGVVAYVGRTSGADRLVLRAGHSARTILSGGGLSGTAFSPLGRRIAVSRATSTGRAIWVLDAEGTGLRQVSPPGGHATEPAWSPGGDRLAFAEGPAGKRRIYVIGADGTGLHRLTSARRDEHGPAWSVRDVIAYVLHNPSGDDVYTVAASGGGKPRRLTRARGADTAPSWSPDGRRLVFLRGGALWIMAADGRHAHRVVRPRAKAPTGPHFSPDGRHLLFAAGRPGRRRVYRVDVDGRRQAAISSARADARFADWQPAGADPVIEAAGDIACDPDSKYFNNGAGVPRHCGQRRTGDLLLDADLSAVLPLGDEQYGHGELAKFAASYGATWGLTKALQHPVPGNHEYSTDTTATGYYDYFNGPGVDAGPAGSRSQGGFYSFDVGAWHLIALNSNCDKLAGGCGPGSPENAWLTADLAQHRNLCTLAYFHHPAFSSAKGVAMVLPLFQTLYDGGADLVLNGHHHDYERFAPQSPAGVADPARGIREIIVGTGGESIARTPPGRAANSQVFQASTFGVLRLALHPAGYDWRFLAASADRFTDSGSGTCH